MEYKFIFYFRRWFFQPVNIHKKRRIPQAERLEIRNLIINLFIDRLNPKHMTKYLYFLYSFCLLAWLSGCQVKPGSDTATKPPFNPYVEAFTTGKISRYAPVYLIFSESVAPDKATAASLKKQLRIRPDVSGEFQWENDRTVVFHPSGGFAPDTDYRLTADLSDWFEAEGKAKDFTFGFTTLPLALKAHLQSLDINDKNENGYDLICTVYTPDRETPGTVESLVRFSEPVQSSWQHSPDGKKHELTLTNVPAGAEASRTLTLSVAPNKQKLPEEDLLQIEIPGQQTFAVYDATYVSQPERYVEVTFTKRLDPDQELRGLAFIGGNKSEIVRAEGNKLFLYPDPDRTGALNVHINKGIRSGSGLNLPADVTRQVQVESDLPGVRFVGNGVIIPGSDKLTVPFQAIYLRGVTARVIKIFEQNIGQFLQVNNLDETSDLMRVGRLVGRRTIFLDEAAADLSHWNTYAVDLSQLIEPEPGAIYRLELSFDKSLSAYPCADSVKRTKQQILADDEIKLKEETSRFDAGGYYYYNNDLDWSDYNYNERNDPCTESYYFNKSVGKNVLASNLGLTAMAGEAGELIVLVHNLLDTNPMKGVKVVAYNFQNQAIAAGETDEKGSVNLSLSTGKPFYLIGSDGKQRAYLRVDDGSALSLSSFDVSGEVVQKGLKGFIYGDRGVWRPGDTLFLGFMLNDQQAKLPASHPVNLELYNPLGQLYTRQIRTRGELGLYTFALPTEADAPTGVWNARITVGGVTFDKRLRIESIKPNRLKIDLRLPEKVVLKGEPLDARLHVEWLQGATARRLKYDIQATFIATPTTFPAFPGFYFDDPARTFNSEESKLISGQTDDEGNATIPARFEVGSAAPGMLKANLVTRVFEESGDFSIDGSLFRYSPYKRYAGIKSPQHEKEQLNTGTTYTYEVASVGYQGNPVSGTDLEVSLFKVNWYWWWSSDQSNLASYMSDAYNKPVKNFTVRTGADGKGRFSLAFTDNEWGTYFISVKDKDSKHAAGILSYFDWPYNQGRRDAEGADAASVLRFKTDKEEYKPGEKMTVTIPSSQGSRAIVSIENGSRVLSVAEYTCAAKETTLQWEVTPEMQPNAYVYITLLQPHGLTKNDLPIRLYGVVPFTVTSAESHLLPQISVASEIKPETPYTVGVSEKNGREMAYTLAIVDEGLLDLTHFRTPEPWKAFNAREALGVRTWDLYNYVVGAYGGKIEQLFSIGGDDALNKGPKAIVNRFRPVVVFDGPFLLKKGQTNRHTYTMPNYNGRVKVMVVAGNGQAYGHADKTAMVRKPVMLLGTLPRVIGVGEEMSVPATVFATEDGVGPVQVSIVSSPNMEVIGAASQTLTFERKGDRMAVFRIRVKDQPGTGQVTITATGKGEKAVYATPIEIRSVRQPQVKVVAATLEAGKTWKQTVTLPGEPATNSLSLDVADVPPLNLAARLDFLIDYPHGCVEQIVSKAFPQLYLPQLADLTARQQEMAEEAVKEVIRRLRSYQTVEGAFAYWPGGTSVNGWGTVYAAHFLLAAEGKGYVVPESLKKGVLANLRLVARAWKAVESPEARSERMTEAYRLYVLALAGTPEVGAMNRLKELSSLSSTSRWLLASAYALAGRKDVAETLIRRTTPETVPYGDDDLTFGSDVRDQAIRLQTLCLLGNGQEAGALAVEISKVLASDEWLSTQSTAYALVAMSEYMQRYPVSGTMNFSYTAAGKGNTIRTDKHFWMEPLLDKAPRQVPVEVTNRGESTLFVRVITEGVPAEGKEEAYAEGISLAVSYVDGSGRAVQVADLKQGANFTAVVTVKNASSRGYRYLVLSEIFPAGWEILNTRFLDGTATAAEPVGVSYQDIRDDRVYSYIDNLPSGRQVTVRIPLCAVYPGRFYLPPVSCQAMYDRLVRANTRGEWVKVE